MIFFTYKIIIYLLAIKRYQAWEYTKSIEELAHDYEVDKNSMIAVSKEELNTYDEFYGESDDQVKLEISMEVIFFGPSSSFLRLDAETVLHIFIHTKKHFMPISRVLLAWDIITDGKSAAFLQGREFLAFGSLLNVVPEEDLYNTNFGDPSVFRHFSSHNLKLSSRKYGVLVAAYKRYFGDRWYLNGSYINELGYLLCGFPSSDLMKIDPKTFKDLNADVLSKLSTCSVNQTKTLYTIAINSKAYGHPYEWSSHVIARLNTLFVCIPSEDISSIPLEAIAAITPIVMKLISQKKLKYFTKQQILRMNQKARRIYILRLQLLFSFDPSQIAKHEAYMTKSCCIILALINFTAIIVS